MRFGGLLLTEHAAPLSGHTSQDTEVGGYLVPKGMQVHLDLWGMHRCVGGPGACAMHTSYLLMGVPDGRPLT